MPDDNQFKKIQIVNSAGAVQENFGGGSGGGSTGSVTAAGANGTQAQAIQGINNGVPVPVAVPVAASGKVVETIVDLPANASTTLIGARPERIAVEIQPDGTAAVGINQNGGAIASLAASPRVIPAGSYPLYTPPIATLTAITAFTATAQKVRVTEYLK